MQEEPSVACGERNFARLKVCQRAVVDLNFIARPKAWQHAFAEDAQAHSSVVALAQDVRQPSGTVRAKIRVGRSPLRVQEVFFENWHWPTVEIILPHDSASVSKTRSWRNAGLR